MTEPSDTPAEPTAPDVAAPVVDVPEAVASEVVLQAGSPTPESPQPAPRPGFLASLRADPLTIFAATTAAFILTVSRYHCTTGEYHRLVAKLSDKRGGLFAAMARSVFGDGAVAEFVARATEPTADHIYWFTSSWVLFLVLPLLAARVIPGVKGQDLGAGFGDWKFGLKATLGLWLVMLPFVVGASFTEPFQRQYPMAGGALRSWPAFVTYEVTYLAYFVAWEWVHRGLLCVGLYPRLGGAVIWLHSVAFAVMHAGKPELEAYGSIAAAVALGALAVRTGSFWYGALLHAAVAFTMDVLSILQTGRWPGGAS